MTTEQGGSRPEGQTAKREYTRADIEAERGDPRGTPEYEDERRRMQFGEIVRTQREVSGLSRAELAQQIGATQEGVARLERGGYELPSIDALAPVLRNIFTPKEKPAGS